MPSVAFDPSQPFSVEGEEDNTPKFDPSQPFEVAPEPGILSKAATAAGEFIGTVGSDLYKTAQGVAQFAASHDPTQAERFTKELSGLQQERQQVQSQIDAGNDVEGNQEKLRNIDQTVADRTKDMQAMLGSAYNQPEATVARREANQETANKLGDIAQTAETMYGQEPGDTTFPAQIGRGAGHVAAIAPTMAAGPLGLAGGMAQGASMAYADAHEQSVAQQRQAGETDEAKIEDQASQDASKAALATAPQLAAYMFGGKLSSMAVAKLFSTAAPLIKGIAGAVGASASNIASSAAIRAAEGQPIAPTAEGLTQDILFGLTHGVSEGIQAAREVNQAAPASPEVQAKTVEIAHDTAQQAANLQQNYAPETAKAITEKAAQQIVSLHEEGLTQENYSGAMEEEIKSGEPISADDVEKNHILLPQGYKRVGDQYIFEAETPAEGSQTPEDSFAPAEQPEAAAEPATKSASNGTEIAEPESIVEQANEPEVPTETAAPEPETPSGMVEPTPQAEAETPEVVDEAKAQAEIPSEQTPPAVEQAEPTAPAVGQKVRLGKQITPFEIVESLPQSKAEKANGEQYFNVKNTKTGEIQTVESKDFTPVKTKNTPNEKAPKSKVAPVQPILPAQQSGEGRAQTERPIGEKVVERPAEPLSVERRANDLRRRGTQALGKSSEHVNYDALASLENHGVGVTFNREENRDSAAIPHDDGRVTINLNPVTMEGVSSERVKAVVQEEVVHAAAFTILRDQWKKEGSKDSFTTWLHGKGEELASNLLEARNKAPEKDRESIDRVLVAAHNIYYAHYGSESPPIRDFADLVQSLKTGDETRSGKADQPSSINYIIELTRMLHQERENGRISESTLQSFLRVIKGWLGKAYANFREGIQQFSGEGLLSKTQAARLALDVEKVLQGRKPSEEFIPSKDKASIEKLDEYLARGEDEDLSPHAAEVINDFALTPEQQKLVNDNQNLAYSIANQYRNIPKEDYGDLKHEAVLALSAAAKNYNPAKGQFAQIASTYINNKLKSLYTKQLRRSVRDAGSLNEQLPSGDEKIEGVPAPAEKPQGDAEAISKIQKAVQALPERERRILELKAEGLSLREISDRLKPDYNLSHEYVNQLYKKTAAELQSQLRKQGITSREDVFPEQSERTQYLPERKSPEDETRIVEQATEQKLAGEDYTNERKFDEHGDEEELSAASKPDEMEFGSRPEKDFRDSIAGLEKGSHKKGDAMESLKAKGEQLKDFAKEMYDSIPAKAKGAYKAALHDPRLSNFKKVLLKWDGNRQKASVEIRRTIEDINRVAPSPRDQVAVTNYLQADGDKAQLEKWRDGSKNSKLRQGYQDAIDLDPTKVKLAEGIKKLLEDKFQEGLNAGIFKSADSFRKNYVTQFWKMVAPEETTQGMYGKLARTFKFAKERKFNNFFEGEQAGFKPASKKISDLLGVYLNEFDKTQATRDLIKDLTRTKNEAGEALATTLGGMKSGGSTAEPNYVRPLQSNEDVPYKPIAHTALQNWKWIGKEGDKNVMLQGQIGLHPDIYQHMKNVLGHSAISEWYNTPSQHLAGNVFKGAAKVLDKGNRAFANSMLGGLSTFHMVHEMKRAGGWRINPFKVEKLNPDDPKFQDATKHGLGLAGDNEAMSHFIEGFGGQWNIWHTVPPLGRLVDTYTGWLFHEYIPALKLKTYNEVLDRNMSLYKPELDSGKMTPDDVKYVTAQLVNARYGHLNRVDIGRDPTMQHFLRVALLAPDFLESNIKNYGLAAKGVYSKSGREALYGFLVTAAFISAAAKILNTVVDDKGDPHFEEPFGVVHNGKVYTMRNEAEDLYRALAQTRGYIMGRVSPAVASVYEALSGKNYRGEKLSNADVIKDIALKWVPITLRAIPPVSRAIDPEKTTSAWDQFLSSQGVQVARRSPINEGYKLAGEYEKGQGKKEDTGTYPSSPYLALRYAIEDKDPDKAKKELLRLADNTGKPPMKIYEGFKESLLRPWTSNKVEDAKFKNSLKGAEAVQFKIAEEARQRAWDDFNKVYREAAPELIAQYRKKTQQKGNLATNP